MMSFSRIWRIFRNKSTQAFSNQSHSQYERINPNNAVDDAEEFPLFQIDVHEDEAKIEEPELHAEQSEETITAWRVVIALSTIVFASENRPRIIAASLLTTINTALNYVAPLLLGKMI